MKRACFRKHYVMMILFFFPLKAFAKIDNLTAIRQGADQTFLDLQTIFSRTSENCYDNIESADECIYWQLGNSFDAILDYFDLDSQSASNAQYFAELVIKAYPILVSPKNVLGACWYDDFGWWAMGSGRAKKRLHLWSSNQSDALEKISEDSWNAMQTGTQVWDLCKKSFDCMKNFSQFEPKIEGGVWNFFWFPQSGRPYIGVCNADQGDPTDSMMSLTGRQNTVTNGLYVNTALGLVHSVPKDLRYQQQASRSHRFLMQWMSENSTNSDTLLKQIPDFPGAAVARERVPSFKNRAFDSGYVKDLAWSADQGFILNEIVAFMSSQLMTPPQKPYLMDLARIILTGSKMYFTNSKDTLYSWSNSINPNQGMGPAPGNDPGDYNTGISVFLRHLVSVYKANKDLKNKIISLGYPDIIYKMATNVLVSDDKLCDPLQSCSPLVKDTNKLALFVAAINLADGVSP